MLLLVGTISMCVIFTSQMMSQNNCICKLFEAWNLTDVIGKLPHMRSSQKHGICVSLSIDHDSFPYQAV